MKKKNKQIQYPSSSVLLEISKDEYSKERDRSNNFENKSGLFITGIIALLTIYLNLIPFDTIINSFSSSSNVFTIVFSTICCILQLIALICIIMSFTLFVTILDSKKYMRVDFDNLSNESNNMLPPDIMMYALVDHYHTILLFNADINNKKAESFSKGVKYTLTAFIILLVSTILSQIL